jgi:hypothetical protein
MSSTYHRVFWRPIAGQGKLPEVQGTPNYGQECGVIQVSGTCPTIQHRCPLHQSLQCNCPSFCTKKPAEKKFFWATSQRDSWAASTLLHRDHETGVRGTWIGSLCDHSSEAIRNFRHRKLWIRCLLGTSVDCGLDARRSLKHLVAITTSGNGGADRLISYHRH